MNNLKAISLFSGMGGDTLGLHNAGVEVIAYSEINKKFRKTHEINFENCKVLGEDVNSDITKISDEEILKLKNSVDIIFAGFPCQGFSNAGKKKLNDPRNTLFKEFVRTTKLLKPKIIIGENVKGLLSRKTSDQKNYIDVITNEFAKLGYKCIYQIFKCSDYNIPQSRERLIILGIHNEHINRFKLEFPTKEKKDKEKCSLKNIIKFDMTGSIKINKSCFDFTSIPDECIIKDLNNEENENNPHPYLVSKVNSNVLEYKEKTYKSLLSFGKRISPIHIEIIDIRKPSKTIICTYNHQPRLMVPLQNKNGYYLRTLLPDELKQIQGFPEDYNMFGNNKDQIIQIGNAIPPPLITKIVKNII